MIHYVTQNGIGNAWVANELSRVEAGGVPYVLHSMRRPDKLLHGSAWALRLNEATRVIYPLPPLGLLLSLLLAPLLFGGRFFAALSNALFGRREHLRARAAGIAHLAVACHWARQLRRGAEPVTHIHSQWINSCGTIAMDGAWLLDVPYSFTGHATDLYRDRCALLDKIARADFIVCISEFHRRFYLEHGARPEQLIVAYCGIDPAVFYPPATSTAAPDRPYRIVASGRLVEKKGFAYLIDACRLLADRGERFDCVIGGSGPLESELRAHVARVGLADRITITGQALLQEKIIDFMHGGDVYVLPCVWAADGDVDGLPQMLMEAMASGLPAISTRLVGIPDLIRDGETGLLVPPNDAAALADAIARLMHDRALGHRLADDGRRWVHQRFDLRDCLEPLIERYRQRLGLARHDAVAAAPAHPPQQMSRV
ncbi:glycosyltransferase [uncultured Methylibium sp.]|uniref:glycosyltransferase n=1 Tax=uncultured Methylibium sp. TaxID=381093 RepID=UPI0025F065CD|nr:glycosyltransferase [uncultured Methylibium sp.]